MDRQANDHMLAKIISITLLLGASLGAAWAVPSENAGNPPVPPDLFFKLKEVPPGENGIINWRRAGAIMVLPDEKVRKAYNYCWTPGERKPDDNSLAHLQNWLNENQEALRLFDESLQKPRMQWPVHETGKIAPEIMALAYLIKARLLKADQMAEIGHFSEATRSLSDSLILTQYGIDSDASLYEYAVAGLNREKVQEAMLRLAARNQVPLSCLQQLLVLLPELNGETNTYAHALRVDFSVYDYVAYDQRQIPEEWSKITETNLAMMTFPKEFRRPARVLLDPALVSQHPLPLDLAFNIESDIRHYRIFLRNSLGAWTNRSSVVEDEREAAQAKLLVDVQPLMELVKDEPLPLSRQAAQKARNAYLKITNPVGRILGINSVAEDGSRIFRFRTGRAAARTVLALLFFERQKGVLPASLADLVNAGILKKIPTDPFSGAPMLYSRPRQIVWSVGENGVDDHGSGTEFHFVGDDAVWKIPELN